MDGPDAMLDALCSAAVGEVAMADVRAADAVAGLDPLSLGVRSRAAVERGGPAARDALVLLHARLCAATAAPAPTAPDKLAAARVLLAEFADAVTAASKNDVLRTPVRWVLTAREAGRLALLVPRGVGLSRSLVSPMRDACRKLAPTRAHVVPLHADYVAVCIHACYYDVALYFVDAAVAQAVERAEKEKRVLLKSLAVAGGSADNRDGSEKSSELLSLTTDAPAASSTAERTVHGDKGCGEENGLSTAASHSQCGKDSSEAQSSSTPLEPDNMNTRTAMDIANEDTPSIGSAGTEAEEPFVSRTVYDPQSVGLSAADVLCEHYYLSVVYTALNCPARALQHCRLALAVPSSVLCDIAVAAYRRYVLLSLLHTGKVPTEPTICSYTANRLRGYAVEYIELGKVFAAANIDEVRKLSASHRQLFDSHGNAGLVERLVAAVPRRAVCALTSSFVSLSLTDVAKQAQLGSDVEAEALIANMVAAGEIQARLDVSRGVVRFSADEEIYGPPYVDSEIEGASGQESRLVALLPEIDSPKLSGADLSKVLSCVERIQQFRNAVLCDTSFIARKLAAERELQLSGADGHLGIGMEDEHDID